MPQKGRDLERLVGMLERVLAPEGAVVKSPDFIPDRVTGKEREVDVSIRMNVGSIHVLVIVECHDRTKVDDVTWVEQVAQKRSDLCASKAVVVSTSGFSDGAAAKARFYGIDARLVGELAAEDVRAWFKAPHMNLTTTRADFKKLSVILEPGDEGSTQPEFAADVIRRMQADGLDAKVFTWKATGQERSINDIWRQIRGGKARVFRFAYS